jgi:hypothetical protein
MVSPASSGCNGRVLAAVLSAAGAVASGYIVHHLTREP